MPGFPFADHPPEDDMPPEDEGEHMPGDCLRALREALAKLDERDAARERLWRQGQARD